MVKMVVADFNEDDDYLVKLKRSRKNIVSFLQSQQIIPESCLGKSFTVALDLLDKEIEQIEVLRSF